jgi:hypothetical protein
MSPRLVLALVAIAVLSAGGALVAERLRPEPAAAVLSGEPILPELRAQLSAVQRIRVRVGDGGYVLARAGDGDGWVAASAHGYPVKPERVNRLLVGLANLERIEPKTADPARFARLSVGDPERDPTARLVRLTDAEGAVLAELIVGRQRHGLTGRADAGTYVRRPDGTRAWLAAGLADLSDGIYPWLQTLVIDVDPGAIRRIEITHAEGGRLVAVRPQRGAPALAIADVPAGRGLSVEQVRRLGSLLAQVKFDAVEPAGGFRPDRRLAQSVVRTFDGLAVTLDVMRRDGRYWLQLRAAPDAKAPDRAAAEARAAALNARVAGWSYQVADYVAERLTRRLDDLLADPG